MKVKILGVIFLGIFAVGCSSISTLQDARTTAKGELSHTFSAGTLSTEVDADGTSGVSGDIGETVSLPLVEYMIRYGFTDSFDAGFKYSGYSYGADIKWNFLEVGGFLMSIGAVYTLFEFTLTSGSSDSKLSSTDLTVPLYMSYDFNKTFTAYLVPKQVNRTITGGTDDVSVTYTGGTLGAMVKIGAKKSKAFLLEYTMLPGGDDAADLSQFNFGFKM